MSTVGLTTFVQLAVLSVMIPLAVARPTWGYSLGRRMGRLATRTVRPWLAPWLCGLFSFLGSAAFALRAGLPLPHVHDEFSYLLAANTFASGRLTNPTPPYPEHFETFHVLQVPTYSSKYPPGQGLLLALGELVGGHPAVGAWIGSAIANALICWMLQGWLSFRWALAGGGLSALILGFSSPWSQTYWAGTLGVSGGALVLGSIRRMAADGRPFHGVTLALGLATLAVSRPFEGLVFSLPAGLLMGAWGLKILPGPSPRSLSAIGLVAIVTLAPFAWGLAQHNHAVTGRFTRMPYVEYGKQYGGAPVFLWANAREVPEHSNEVFRRFQEEWALPIYHSRRTLRGYLAQRPLGTLQDLASVLTVALFLPVVVLALFGRRWWDWYVFLSVFLVVGALLGDTFHGERKLSPAAGGLILLAIQGLRHLRLWRPGGRPLGRALARALVFSVVLSALLAFVPMGARTQTGMARDRAEILKNLEETGERHLVFVRYSPNHNVHDEWVYNLADLEEAKVVWARDLTPEKNRRLLDHFSDRRAWLLQADRSPPELSEYELDREDGSSTPASGSLAMNRETAPLK